MEICMDRIGFPIVKINGSGFFHFWPVTRVQFEAFISEPNDYGDGWYETVLKLNPRLSWSGFEGKEYERLFMTGVLPEEALDFAAWLGDGYDLPTVMEWRAFFRGMQSEPKIDMADTRLSPAAGAIWRGLDGYKETAARLSLLEDGLVEWVRNNGNYAALGAPRPSFYPNAWDPLTDLVEFIRPGTRIRYAGFRLIKREPTLA